MDGPAKRRKPKLSDAEQLAEWLEEASLEMCQGGYGQPYPDTAAVVAGHVVVASLDPGKEYNAPDLSVYPPDVVAAWVQRIREYIRDVPECDLIEAINETHRG